MSGYFGELDLEELADALSRPGMDTRVWVSYGIVDREQEDQHSVEFDPEWGPLVRVVLQPHNQVVSCRVAASVAGNGESEWHPFLQADEVLVVVPEGDTRSFPVIVGRLNNSYDKFPERVAGQETNKNNLGFRRFRGPYYVEGDSSLVIRSSDTGAMIGIDETGNATLRNGDGMVFQLGATGLAMQNQEGDMQVALDTEKRVASIGVGGSVMRLAETGTSQLGVGGTLEMSACGVSPVEHLVTLEQLVNILASLLTNVGSGAPLGFFPGVPGTGFPDRSTALGAIGAALMVIAPLPITPVVNAAITTALQIPKVPALPTGQNMPGVGCVGLLGG